MNEQTPNSASQPGANSGAGNAPQQTPLTPAAPPAAPAAPQYQPPVAPAAPAAPQYQPPAAPAAPQYQAPAAPQYQAPAVPQYQTIPQSAPGQVGAPQGAGAKTNVMAILSLIFAFVFSIVGIVLGHVALSQIKKTGEGGRGLALTGLILSYVFTFLGAIIWLVYIIAMIAVASSGY